MSKDEQKPNEAPLTAMPPENRKRDNREGGVVYPKSNKARNDLIDGILKTVCRVCVWLDFSKPETVAELRNKLVFMGASKLTYLKWVASMDKPPSDKEIMAQVKRMRLDHCTTGDIRDWDNDHVFQWFRRAIQTERMEMMIPLEALENVYQAVSRRKEDGTKVLDRACVDMTVKVLEKDGSYFASSKKDGATVNVNIKSQSEIKAETDAKMREMGKLAEKDPEAGRIILALKRGIGQAKLVATESGEIKIAGEEGNAE